MRTVLLLSQRASARLPAQRPDAMWTALGCRGLIKHIANISFTTIAARGLETRKPHVLPISPTPLALALDAFAKPSPVVPIVPIVPALPTADELQFASMYQKVPDICHRSARGCFAGWRWFFVWLTLVVFYGMPWLQWGGRQVVLFDLEAQRCCILGLVLYPQDLICPVALLVLSALARFLFTAVAGRLWCGHSCPQTA